jgi:crotonobetaine/carnitine-CoA ligase
VGDNEEENNVGVYAIGRRKREMDLKKENEIIIEILEKWADEKGEKTFLFYGEENLKFTFREFNQLANSIGHNLTAMGIEKGDRVSLFLKNPLIIALSMFGIWKTGAVYCPINFNYKGRLLSYQINDTQPKLLITERGLLPIVNDIAGDIPSLKVVVHSPKESDHDYDSNTAKIALNKNHKEYPFKDFMKGDVSNIGTDLRYMDTANIIYTSGTTGPAKGVVESYRWMNNYLFNWRRFFNEEDVIYNDLPLYHVGGAFFNLVRAAWVGCQAALWDRFSSKDFWKRINVSGATSAVLLDVMIPYLMSAEETPDDYKNTLNKVYMQPLPQYHNQVAKRFGFDFVVSGFGQTETGHGHICIINELKEGGTPSDLYKGYSKEEIVEIAKKYNIAIVDGKKKLKKGFMGKPSALFEAAILNENDEECPPGEVGELVFRPKFPYVLHNEYFGKPEATVKSFRNLWFHTGDACEKDEEGYYYFVDRMGGVIRVRGELVSSYQVEDIINSYPKVDVCAALPIPSEIGDEDDIAVFIVPKSGEELQEKEIRDWAKGEMPKFMWPKYIRFIDDLPRTPTSKVEKYKLREKIKEEMEKG